MILDSLTHLTRSGKWFNTKYKCSEKLLLSSMESDGVDKAMVTGLPLIDENLYILDVCKKSQERLVPLPLISSLSEQALELELNDYISKGAKCVKLHPRFCKISLSDRRIHDLFELCESYKITVFVCTVPNTKDLVSGMTIESLIISLVNAHPNVKTVLLHGGYTHLLSIAELVRPYENVLVDLSATLTRFYDSSIGLDIKYLFRHFETRLTLGSDFPEYSYHDVKECLIKIDLNMEYAVSSGIAGKNLYNLINA